MKAKEEATKRMYCRSRESQREKERLSGRKCQSQRERRKMVTMAKNTRIRQRWAGNG